MTFRVNAKNYFLTYPKAQNITLDQLHQHLSTYGNAFTCEEQHLDGTLHFHSLLTFQRKKDCRDQTLFDFQGNHPNIQAARNVRDVAAYIGKDGKTLGTPPNEKTILGKRQVYTEALAQNNQTDFLNAIKEGDPEGYVKQQDSILSFARLHFNKIEEYEPSYTNFSIPDILEQWRQENLNKIDLRPYSLVLVGETRMGKTEWARSLGTHIYWNGMQDLTLWNNNALYAIFDDIEWEFIKQKKGFVGCQKQITLTAKYTRIKTFEWGKPSIFLFNEDNLPNCFRDENSWERKNCVFHRIVNKLY